MNFGTKGNRRRARHMLLAMSVVVGMAACAESSSKDSASSDTVAQTKTKNAALATCTFDSKCSVGATGAAGGTVIYNSPTNFDCGSAGPVKLPCNFLEIAPSGWGLTVYRSPSGPALLDCVPGAAGLDLLCPWTGSNEKQPITKSELGTSKQNFASIKAAVRDMNVAAPAVAAPSVYVSPTASAGVEANPFSLPSLAELLLVCNYANGSPMRTDKCVSGKLKPEFQNDWYWSSTITATDPELLVSTVHFGTGEVRQAPRGIRALIRPTRTFYSTLDVPAASTLPPTTLPPTTIAATTLPPTTIATTTLPPTTTTMPGPRVRACTSASPCKPGDKREGTGGTIFLYDEAGFGCGEDPTTARCTMAEFAQDGWASTLPSTLRWMGCLPETGVDPKCPMTNYRGEISFGTDPDLGFGLQNSKKIVATYGAAAAFAANNFAWNFNQDTAAITQRWNLPSLRELVQLCNWANGSAPRSDVCTPGVLKPNFRRGVYLSSTIDRNGPSQPVWVVNFVTGEIFSQARTISTYVRPVRMLRGYIEPGYVTPATVATTTLPPTTIPRITQPPTTPPPPTTIARTTLPPTTLPPTTIARTTLPPTTLPTCATGGVCNVDDVGPGGGTIIYASSTAFACGPNMDKTCKYLEAAPQSWSATPAEGCQGTGVNTRCPWQVDNLTRRPATERTLGAGAKNTAAMYAASPKGAAATVRSYNGGGKVDWFIPSFAEMNEFCKWAHFEGSGQTIGDLNALCKISFHMSAFYGKPPLMTSTDVNADNAYAYLINATSSSGPLVKELSKTDSYMVWPIRAF